jgi:hypothetical protein
LLELSSWLAPAERQSLSCTCRALFAFINTNAPFRNLNLKGGRISELLLLHHHARVLASAAAVCWGSRPPFWHRGSTHPWTVKGQSFRFMLSVLQTSTSLHTLQLAHVKVKPAQQLLILSIPTLKTLILEHSQFIPTAIELPLSSITSLSFAWTQQPAPIEHILRPLRNSLDRLEVKWVTFNISLIIDTVQLPNLTCFTGWGVDASTLRGFTPRASSTITKLCITARFIAQPLGLSDIVLPQLRELYSPWWIGVQLVPGRPVQVFYDTEMKEVKLSDLQTRIAWLSQSTRGVEVLRLYTLLSIPCLLQRLAMHVPRLQPLHLWTRPESLTVECIESEQTAIDRKLSALTEIHITLLGSWYHMEWYPVHSPTCSILSKMYSWICPALEVAKISITQSRACFRVEDNIPSQQMFKLRRRHTGKWEELI